MNEVNGTEKLLHSLVLFVTTKSGFCVSAIFGFAAVSRVPEVTDGHVVWYDASLCALCKTKRPQAALHVSILHLTSIVNCIVFTWCECCNCVK